MGALRCRTASKSKSSAEKKRRSGATEATQLKAKVGARANESDAKKETRSHTERSSTEARRVRSSSSENCKKPEERRTRAVKGRRSNSAKTRAGEARRLRDTLKWRKPWRADTFPEGKPYLTSAALEASGIDMFKCMCAEGDLVRVSGGESVEYIADTNRNSTSKTYRYKSRYICPNKGVAQHGEIHMRLVQPKRQSALYSTVQHTDGYPIASQKSVCASEVVREQQSGRRCCIREQCERCRSEQIQ